MKNVLIFSLLLTSLHFFCEAQTASATLVGRVLDTKTGQPLPFATVYLNNSTRGTTADEQGLYRLIVPLGNLEVIGSMVGYQPARQSLRITAEGNRQLNFSLTPSLELSDVTVTAKRTRRWERLQQTFSSELLGVRPPARECRILNLDKVQLTQEGKILRASVTEPLIIENRALGYRLHYNLLNFEYNDGKLKLAGAARFESLSPASAEEAARWRRNRLKEYRGSLRHLLASLAAGTTEREGFELYQARIGPDPMRGGVVIQVNGERKLLRGGMIDSLISPGGVPFERKLVSLLPLEVYYKPIYANNSPYVTISYRDRTSLPNVPYAYSAIFLPSKVADFTTDGWITRSYGMDARGYFGQERLASLLPQDWTPAQDGSTTQSELVAGKALPVDALLDSLARPEQALLTAATPNVFVHIDKPFYMTGDALWLSAFVTSAASRLPLVGETLPALRVELLAPNGQVVQQQWLALRQGRSEGRLRLSDTLVTGMYRLRAYTTTQAVSAETEPAFERFVVVRNAFESDAVMNLSTPPPSTLLIQNTNKPNEIGTHKPYDVQFLPEGGRWLAGVPGRLGIKIVSPEGRGRTAQGQIIDEEGAEIARFQTNVLGMGRVSLTPRAGQRYRARLAIGSTQATTVNLPPTESEGLSVTADVDSVQLRLTIRGRGRLAAQPVYAVLASRGALLWREKWQLRGGELHATLPLAGLPAGVVRLTIYDGEGRPQAERLFFVVDPNAPVQVDVSLGQARYKPRQIVGIGLRFHDSDGRPVAAQWSAAIHDAEQVSEDTLAADIRTHLLLTGELRGYVERPSWYFQEGGLTEIDNLLLAQGWRRYAKSDTATSLGWSASGRVMDAKGQPQYGAQVVLSLESSRNNLGAKVLKTVKTNSMGRFNISNLDGADTVYVRATVLNRAGKLDVLFDRNVTSFPSTILYSPAWTMPANGITVSARERQTAWQTFYRSTGARELAEVTVKASAPLSRERPEDVSRSSIHNKADYTVIPDINAASQANVLEMIRGRIPGFQITQIYDRDKGLIYVLRNTRLPRGGEPLLLLDGVRIDLDYLLTIPTNEVERVEALSTAGAAGIYGTRSDAGVLAFYTKKGPSKKENNQASSSILVGYTTPQEFYTPRYDTPAEEARPDRRDVLFWQPLGRSGHDGLGNMAFPLNDVAKKVRILVQGITAEGTPISMSWILPVQ